MTAGAGSRTSCRPGSPRGGADGTAAQIMLPLMLVPAFCALGYWPHPPGIRADEMAVRARAPPPGAARSARLRRSRRGGERLGAALRESSRSQARFRTSVPISPRHDRTAWRRRLSPFPAAESRSRPAWRGALGAPLDVIVVRKIGHPGGARARARRDRGGRGGGAAEPSSTTRCWPGWAERGRPDRGGGAGARGAGPAGRRLHAARNHAATAGTRLGPGLVIVVDDGLATGVTARAALRAVAARSGRAAAEVLAVPVAAAAASRP